MEAYCPRCQTTHLFIATHWGWRCNAAAQPIHYSTSELNKAFTSLSQDPEYKEKGISLPMEKLQRLASPDSPNDTTGARRFLTLPIDSEERKGYPLLSGCLKYFSAALASVARTSKLGNDKHNPGQPLHHARGKSMDHGDCIVRHLMDIEDLLAARERGNTSITDRQILDEAGSLAWRALAYSQELHEQLGAAPLAPGAKKE